MNIEHQRMKHPNVHTAFQEWSEDQTLHVAVAYSNPFRWRVRRELLNDFRHHMQQSPNVVLHVGELAYGDRPFEVTSGDNPLDVQMRTNHELFHKENILNAVIQKFPPNWRYGAWIDGDFTMTRHDWALEAIHQLQHYDFVQLFSSYMDLSGRTYSTGMRPLRANNSFAYNYIQSGFRLPTGYSDGGWKKMKEEQIPYHGSMDVGRGGLLPVGATGGAWAFRKTSFDAVGQLLDPCILGHGDWFMAFGLVAEEAPDVGMPKYSEGYKRVISEWQRNAARLKKNIGYIDNFAIHHFHGSKLRRFYSQRYQILIDHKFDPLSDLRRDWQGIYQLSGDKPGLRDAIREYFIVRSEDDPTLSERAGEKPLV
jgi:hypothetical protein